MKTQNKKTKNFDTVKTFRKIKENISKEIQDMSFEELKAWLEKNKLKSSLKQSH
jgi:hypothetical protein